MISVSKDFFGPGVYHLIDKNEAIYIGASINAANRVRSWATDSVLADKFDAVAFFPVDDAANLSEAEAAHIARHRPRYNRAGVTSHYIPHAWELPELRRESPEPTYKRTAATRREYVERVPGVAGNPDHLAAHHLSALALVGSNLSNTDLANSIAALGGPQPVAMRKAGNGVSLFWLRADVLSWLDQCGPFPDEAQRVLPDTATAKQKRRLA